MSARRLLAIGTALAVLSLGLPWGAYAGTQTILTPGYYTPYYCDYDGYCYGGYYIPGQLFFGYEGGTFAGTWSTARFFIVGALVLGLLGWRLVSPRLVRAAAVVAALGIVTPLTAGLTGGALCLGLAGVCFWLAAGRLDPEDVIRIGSPGSQTV